MSLPPSISARWQRKSLEEKRQQDERKDLYEKLNGFYGPVSVLLAEQRILTRLFKSGPYFQAHEGKRTLAALLEGHRFTGNEGALLKEILETSAEIRDLIVEKGGLVEEENRALLDMLSQARAHYRLIQLAYNGELSGDVERFARQVYPNNLDPMIEARKRQLENRLRELNQAKRLDPITVSPPKPFLEGEQGEKVAPGLQDSAATT